MRLRGVFFCLFATTMPATAATQRVLTFTHDVAPIVSRACASCHRPGEVGPFSLLTFADVQSRGRLLAEVVQKRVMPPWKPVHGFGGPFAGERRLTDDEIRTIVRWV